MRQKRIETEENPRWQAPVRVRIGNGMPEAVRGPKEALEKLEFRWPALQGKSYAAAKTKCLAPLSDHASPEDAREEFVKASRDAKMLD